MSHVHSPESNPNPPLPVTTTVVPYTTVESMMGRPLVWPTALRRSTSYPASPRNARRTRERAASVLVTVVHTPPWQAKVLIGARRPAAARPTPEGAERALPAAVECTY